MRATIRVDNRGFDTGDWLRCGGVASEKLQPPPVLPTGFSIPESLGSPTGFNLTMGPYSPVVVTTAGVDRWRVDLGGDAYFPNSAATVVANIQVIACSSGMTATTGAVFDSGVRYLGGDSSFRSTAGRFMRPFAIGTGEPK